MQRATQQEVVLMEYQRDEHRVHLIVYHLIWCPKRRKRVLVGEIAKECRLFLEEKCEEQGWEILELAMQPDPIHLFIRVWPSNCAPDIIKHCKGAPSRRLRQKYPHLLPYGPAHTSPQQQAMLVVKQSRNILSLKNDSYSNLQIQNSKING